MNERNKLSKTASKRLKKVIRRIKENITEEGITKVILSSKPKQLITHSYGKVWKNWTKDCFPTMF